MMRRIQRLLRRLGVPVPGSAVRPAPPPDAPPLAYAPLDMLAAKVMFSHLRNRQQKLGPPPTAFGHLDDTQAELLVRAMVAAVLANGPLDDAKERRVRGALSTFGLQAETRGFVADAIRRPVPLEALLRDVRDPHVGSLFYAASLAALDKHDGVNRAYLHYLASRLKLPQDTLSRLHSQSGFGPALAQPAVPASGL